MSGFLLWVTQIALGGNIMQEFKRCPFCGSSFIQILYRPDRIYAYKVECKECFCGTDAFKAESDAVNMWNRRFDDEQQHDNIIRVS